MEDNVKQLIKDSIQGLKEKKFRIFFFVMDTKGNVVASLANIYEHARILRQLGYDAQILHEKSDYMSVAPILGDEYADIPHVSADNQQLKVNSQDFIIIPEIFANVMEQTSKLPSKRIVFLQSYDYIFEMLLPGKNWVEYGITDVITTTQKQKEYVEDLFLNRVRAEVVKVYKKFYLKYPHLKWVSFRDMRGLPRETFASSLAECCLAIWMDDIASFGTFPVEAMKCNVPVLGLVPNMVPEWMADKNGLWTHDPLAISDLAANYFQAWLEDSEPQEIFEEMAKLKNAYTIEQQTEKVKEVYDRIVENRINELKSTLPMELEIVDVENNIESQSK